ncbi:hypothetical protein BJX76DRAFT_334894 [Aspergillus varians]
MSRNFIPAVLAIAMGIGTGYYTFQPVLRDLHGDTGKIQGPESQSLPAEQPHPPTSTSVPSPKEDGSGK